MKPRQKRLAMIAGGLVALGVTAAFVLAAFKENLVFFFTPSQVAANEVPQGRSFRIGGMVTQGSVKRQADGVTVQFIVTDTAKSVPVVYRGLLPDLFREGKGVVTQGKLGGDGVFYASEVLAKHDENYMPPAAADAIKQAKSINEKAAHTLVPADSSRSSPSPSAASLTLSSPTISRSPTSVPIPTRRCRSPIASPAFGAGTKARSSCGS